MTRVGLLSRSTDPAARRELAQSWLRELVERAELFEWPGLALRPEGGTGPSERPRLRDRELGDVSVSHSGDLLFVAVTDAEAIGIDLEADPFGAFGSAALIRRMCTAEELGALGQRPEATRRRHLADLWTAKEARAKTDARGLAADFRTLAADAPASRHAAGPVGCIAVADGSGAAVVKRLGALPRWAAGRR
jgi:phosphopantetheinyl transferase